VARINYSVNHYCKTCEKKFDLNTFRCDECGMKIRVVPRKQKRKKYVPVPPEETALQLKLSRELREIRVQCKSSNPFKEVRY